MTSATAVAEARGAGASEDMRLTRRLLSYLGEHKGLFILSLCLYPITALTVVAPPYLVRAILDDVIPARDIPGLKLFVGLYLLAVLLEYGTGIASQFAMSVLGQRSMRSLRSQLFGHVQKLPASYYDTNPIGRVLTRLTNDVEALGEVFATGAVTVIGDIVTVVSVVAMMLYLDVKLTLFSFLVVPPLLALTYVFRIFARRAFRDIRRHLARINAYLAEHVSGMSVVQLFRQEERTASEFSQLNRDYRDANRSAILFDALLYSVVEAIGTAAVAALIWWGAEDMATGVVGAGTLVAFVQYIRRFFIPVRDLSTKYTVIQSAFAAAERVFSLLDEPLPIAQSESARSLTKLSGNLELKDVWFAYRNNPTDADYVIKGMNLTMRRGEKVALVGATGSGKTTVLKLLNRTYDINRGSVSIDGTDVRQLHLRELRRLFAVVLQDVYLFSGTVMDNLAFAPGVSRESVIEAAKAVQAHDFIEKLPKGYETPIKELGTNFSAGERQLLAFARALAQNPEVLTLDEATSNVDSETEARIQSALDVLLENRTAIIIAHRLSTIRKVDRILVLQHGRVVEEGDHDSLMRRGGSYANLVELQVGERYR